MSQGYIYFFQDKETADARVKIGRSEAPQERLRSLSSETGHRLTIIGVMLSVNPIVEEATIHRELAEYRIEGEWFTSAALVKVAAYRSRFLKSLPKPKQLVQVWVRPEVHQACVARAKSEGRSLANWFRCQLNKIAGGTDDAG